MIPHIEKYILDNWDKLGLGEQPSKLSFTKFPDRGIRSPEISTVTLLVRTQIKNASGPNLIVRIPRYPGNIHADRTLELEYGNLVKVFDSVNNSDISGTIPRPLFKDIINSSKVIAFSFLPGKDMGSLIGTENLFAAFSRDIGFAFAWLASFQSKFKGEEIDINETFVNEHIDSKVAAYKSLSPDNVPRHEKYFRVARDLLVGARGKKLIIYPQQGDFHASNIFVVNNNISGVIDWEDFGYSRGPFFDILHFIVTYAEALYNFASARYPKGVEAVSEGADWNSAVEKAVAEYCSSLHIDKDLVETFIPVFCLDSLLNAADPRKRSDPYIVKKEMMLVMSPKSIKDLLLFTALPAYISLFQNAVQMRDQSLIDFSKGKIEMVKRTALERADR